jgi:hypothetical protein
MDLLEYILFLQTYLVFLFQIEIILILTIWNFISLIIEYNEVLIFDLIGSKLSELLVSRIKNK